MTLRPTTRRFACIAALAIVSASPLAAQSTGAKKFSKGEKPFATISRMFLKDDARDSLVQLAKSQVGAKYRLGASAPGKAFDCSGLVQWVMANFDVEMPRTSREQAKVGVEIPKDPSQLKPGDLLYFGNGRVVDHIGIYVGEGKYVHAARKGKGVVEAPLPTGRWATRWWKGVRRLFTHQETIDSLTLPTLTNPILQPRLSS
ncbi:MAG TPA: C40 family peptidase [Gemmatimonadales bacterium]|nr:C40 family peptidase [Gemmatimonadales bacterium]